MPGETILRNDEIMFPDTSGSDSDFLNTLYDSGGQVEYIPAPKASRAATAPAVLKPATTSAPSSGLKPAAPTGANYQARKSS